MVLKEGWSLVYHQRALLQWSSSNFCLDIMHRQDHAQDFVCVGFGLKLMSVVAQ